MNRVLSIGLGALLLSLSTGGCRDATEERGAAAAQDDRGGSSAAEAAEPPAPSPQDVEALELAVRERPDDPEALRQFAIALHASRRKQEALEYFERAAELRPEPRQILDLALAYGSVSRLTEAEAAYRRLLESSPNHPIALHNLGNLKVQQGKLDEAIEYYLQALAVQPDYVSALYYLGEALRQAERYEEAYRTFEKVLELEPSSPAELGLYDDALYRMASLDITMGAYERAAGMLAELLRFNPDHPSAHYAYGQALTHLGRHEEARREFEAHLQVLSELEPTGPMAMGE